MHFAHACDCHRSKSFRTIDLSSNANFRVAFLFVNKRRRRQNEVRIYRFLSLFFLFLVRLRAFWQLCDCLWSKSLCLKTHWYLKQNCDLLTSEKVENCVIFASTFIRIETSFFLFMRLFLVHHIEYKYKTVVICGS